MLSYSQPLKSVPIPPDILQQQSCWRRSGGDGAELDVCSMRSCECCSFRPALPHRASWLAETLHNCIFPQGSHEPDVATEPSEVWLVASITGCNALDRHQTLAVRGHPSASLSEALIPLARPVLVPWAPTWSPAHGRHGGRSRSKHKTHPPRVELTFSFLITGLFQPPDSCEVLAPRTLG